MCSAVALEKVKLFLQREGIVYLEDEPLAKYTTIRIGGPVSLMVFPKDEGGLFKLFQELEDVSLPWYVIGGGSNLLCGDDGLTGVVVNLREFKGIEVLEEDERLKLTVLSGTMVSQLLSFTRAKGYSGLEFLAGVPATVGGAVRMNAGAYGKSFSQLVKGLRLYQRGQIRDYAPQASDWTYRSFQKEGIVVSATLEFELRNPEEVQRILKDYYNRRKANQPLTEKTFGSAFKNPPCCYAGQLIEECGLKGYRIGRAKISERHANFVVNLGGARAQEVLELLRKAQKEVEKKFNIWLEPEVKFLGCTL